MTIPVFLGILTLAPLAGGLIILTLGQAHRAAPALTLGIATIAVLIPVICLLLLAPYLASGEPLYATLFGGSIAPTAWFSAAYRIDAFGMYAAFGVAFLVTPLLLWLGWRGAAPGDGTVSSQAQWGGVALTLGIETAALTLLFADNILWLGLAWLVLVSLVWGLGEIGNDLETLDRMGLALMVAGPVVWAAIFLLPATGKPSPQVIYPRFTDMMGRGGMPWPQVVGLALALAFAAGAYPFTAWVRRRAALITPAGLAALVLALVPVAIFVCARTYSAIEDVSNLWPHQQQVADSTVPPITAGIAFVAFGALAVGVSGLLALGRNDARALVAYLAVAQGGWGLIALGAGEPESVLGVPVLLATTVLGGGAAIAALFSGGTLTSDIEPEGAGPRAIGMPQRPLHLAAWSIGVITLIGAPLFGGFVSRQLISAGALHAHGLPIPLVGIAWAGDMLLALALLRATAPAFASVFGAPSLAIEAPVSEEEAGELSMPAATSISKATVSAAQDEDDEESSLDAGTPEGNRGDATALAVKWLPELPAAIFTLLALAVGIVPQALLRLGATGAVAALLQPAALDATLKVSLVGYSAGTASWLPTIAWLVIVPVGALLAFLLPTGTREVRPILLSGQRVDPAEAATELALPSAAEAWDDLAPSFRSELTLPGSGWLLNGTDDTDDGEPDGSEAGKRLQDDAEDDLDADELDGEWAYSQAVDSSSGRMELSGAEADEEDGVQRDGSVTDEEQKAGEPLDTAPSTRSSRRKDSGAFVGAQRGSKNGKARKGGSHQRGRGGRA